MNRRLTVADIATDAQWHQLQNLMDGWGIQIADLVRDIYQMRAERTGEQPPPPPDRDAELGAAADVKLEFDSADTSGTPSPTDQPGAEQSGPEVVGSRAEADPGPPAPRGPRSPNRQGGPVAGGPSRGARTDYVALMRRVLPAALADRVVGSDAYGALVSALRVAEARGVDLEKVLPDVIAARDLSDAADPASALHWRVGRVTPEPPETAGTAKPADTASPGTAPRSPGEASGPGPEPGPEAGHHPGPDTPEDPFWNQEPPDDGPDYDEDL